MPPDIHTTARCSQSVNKSPVKVNLPSVSIVLVLLALGVLLVHCVSFE